jgi:Kdo2-lipid IVA lauroyltransferase/acyltransferase
MADRSAVARRLRALSYPFEALAAVAVLVFFRLLPTDAASAVGGWLGRVVGPRLPITRRAGRNLRRALPELDDAAAARTLRAMWDNFGRMLGEYPHNDAITRDAGRGGRVEIVGEEHIAAIRQSGGPCLLFSGHFANFEIFAKSCAAAGMGYAQVYRAPNNPLVGRLLMRLRRLPPDAIMPKGAAGARKALAVLKQGGRVGMLTDQKMNDGIPVPFFGREAMTAPAVAQLALRFRCPVVPVRMERLGGCRFRMTFHAPLNLPDSGDRHADIAAMMAGINRILEGWIRERPGEWLWLHRRWPDS